MKTLKERFESVVDAYTKAFDKKHEIHDGFWIADIKNSCLLNFGLKNSENK